MTITFGLSVVAGALASSVPVAIGSMALGVSAALLFGASRGERR